MLMHMWRQREKKLKPALTGVVKETKSKETKEE